VANVLIKNTSTNDLSILWPARESIIIQDGNGNILPKHGSNPGFSINGKTISHSEAAEAKYDLTDQFSLRSGTYTVHVENVVYVTETGVSASGIKIAATTNLCSNTVLINVK
jgi:hypothetical protein